MADCLFCHDQTVKVQEWFEWLGKCFENYGINLGDEVTVGEFLDEFNDAQFDPWWTFIECQRKNHKYYLIRCRRTNYEIQPITEINSCPICGRDL